MTNGEQPEEKPVRTLGRWIAIGVGIVAGAGVALDNIAIGMGVGIALGAAIGVILSR